MLISKKDSNSIFFILCLILIGSMQFSRALLSISMILMFVNAVLSFDFRQAKMLKAQRNYLTILLILFGVGLLSYFNSSNKDTFFNYIRIWLPMVFLPFSIFSQPTLSIKQYFSFWAFFVFCVTLGTFWSWIQFLENPKEIIKLYQQAKVIPTPFKGDHVRFSLVSALAACVSVFLAIISSKKTFLFRKEKQIFIGLAIYLFLFLHVLAVKSGLLAGWLAFGWLVLFFIFKKNIKMSILLSAILIGTPLLSYFFIPTFQQKIAYTQGQFDEHERTGRVAYMSDVNRLVSYNLSWKSIKKNPICGVGLGDINDETYKNYKEAYPSIPDDSIILPHNQWLCTGLALGFPGIILIILVVFFPLSIRNFRLSFLGICILIINIVSFMFEPVLMVQFGMNLFIFFTLIVFRHYTAKTTNNAKLIFSCESLNKIP